MDERGWTYFVRAGLSLKTFKTFYLKPGQKSLGHGSRIFEWKDSFKAAQEDLNRYAKVKGWKLIKESEV